MRRTASALLLALAVLGCSHYDFDISSDEPTWGEAAVAPDQSDAEAGLARLAKVLAARQEEACAAPAEYLIGPGDVLAVSVFSLEAPGAATRLTRTVSQEGKVSLPWVGEVAAAGLSAPQLEERIKAAYAGSYLKKPQVAVNVEEYRSVPVVVTGAVDKPGLYYLKSNRSSVLECLALAGGLKATAGNDLLVLRGVPATARAEILSGEPSPSDRASRPPERETIAVDLKQLVGQGNMLMNIQVRATDVLIVPERTRRYIYVLGYVQRPGAYELEDAVQLDALRAVALGGGLGGIARPDNAYLIRQAAAGQTTTPVDLAEMARGEVPPLYLRPGDMLVVGTSTLARMSQFLAPGMGANLSASASVAK